MLQSDAVCNLQSIIDNYRVLQNVTECYSRVLQSVTGCYRVLQSVIVYYRVLQSITEYYSVLQSITEYYRVLQSITKKNLAHLLGPISGLVFNMTVSYIGLFIFID